MGDDEKTRQELLEQVLAGELSLDDPQVAERQARLDRLRNDLSIWPLREQRLTLDPGPGHDAQLTQDLESDRGFAARRLQLRSQIGCGLLLLPEGALAIGHPAER